MSSRKRRQQTPIFPEDGQRRVSASPAPSDHVYNSPASTLCESIDNSPEYTPPAIPPHQDQLSLWGGMGNHVLDLAA